MKKVLSNNERFASIFNNYFFEGKNVIDPNTLKDSEKCSKILKLFLKILKKVKMKKVRLKTDYFLRKICKIDTPKFY